ncbi:Ankyrin repeat domain-containing 17 [Fusarium albosuccineum]|uniref:Ankyrin repeat domain-containing 17 n=1 Tax=Fusarium albosuccineum TaxID=1237068 RepID=A0A8H4L7M8_9HYPO|nr:Ankyrin repeat domain-containing 17 [Fusarium albosuccineum]
MSLRRSATRKAGAGPIPVKKRNGYEGIPLGVSVIHPLEGSGATQDIDIVFVPGLGAHPEKSWASKKTGFNWVFGNDGVIRDFPNARILLYRYQSAWMGDLKVKQYIGDLAWNLLWGLHARREESGSTRPILFVGHSMGGLVIAKAICLADSRQSDVPGIFENIAGFAAFGTPFHGAEAASVAGILGQIGEMFDVAAASSLLDFMKPDSPHLRETRSEFMRMVTKLHPNIPLYGFSEQKDTNLSDLSRVPSFLRTLQITLPKKLAKFVTPESAILDGDMVPVALDANHRDLVKFENFRDDQYQQVRTALKKLVHGAHGLVKSRRQSSKKTDADTAGKVEDLLEGAQVSKKRKNIENTTAASTWIPDEPEYISWLAKSHDPFTTRGDCLWIRGPDGRGKTSATLAALRDIDKMVEETEDSGTVLLAYFFCDKAPDYGTAVDLLKSLVRQLVKIHTPLASHCKFLLKRQGKGDSKAQAMLTIENLWQVLQDMLADESLFGKIVYIVVNDLQVLPQDSDATRTLLDLLGLEITNMGQGGRRTRLRWLITSSGESYSIGTVFKGGSVRLIDLKDKKYEDRVKLDLQKHARQKVTELVDTKKYSKALEYFAKSIIGERAENTQWIDITCVQLNALPQYKNDLHVRQVLEAVPQALDTLLSDAWTQVFQNSGGKAAEIKEMLRVLVLLFEDPTEAELSLLTGLYTPETQEQELRDLINECSPLLNVYKEDSKSEAKVCFKESILKTHLLQNTHKLLGLSNEDTKLQHGMLGFRAFAHIMERFDFPEGLHDQEFDGVHQDEGSGDDGESAASDTESEADSEEDETEADIDVAPGQEQQGGDKEGDNDPETRPGSNASESDSDSDDGSDVEDESDPEAEVLKGRALAYAVKHWLNHASQATSELAESLSLEQDFWKKESIIRRRWLTELNRLTNSFAYDYDERCELPGLHVAAAFGFRQLVAALIKNGHENEKNMRDSVQNTPLHLAAAFDKLDVVEELLDQGALVNDGMEEHEMTPLHMAAQDGFVQIMTHLLQRGASPHAICGDYGGVINAAIESGNCDAVKILVEYNVSLEEKDNSLGVDDVLKRGDGDETTDKDTSQISDENNDDESEGKQDDSEDDEDDEDEEEITQAPLALAASRSDRKMFDFLIENYRAKLPPQEFETALITAAGAGRLETFKDLLTQFEHSDDALNKALAKATYNDHWDITELLLEQCSNLNCDEPFYYTAMGNMDDDATGDDAIAHADKQQLKILQALWEYGNESITPSKLDESLYEATDLQNTAVVELLLRFGASPDAIGEDYGNALTAAAYDGTTHLVTMLLDAGADINSENGWALQAAASKGHVKIVELLLERGAQVDACSTHQSMLQGTALQAAVEAGDLEIVDILLEHGANPNIGGGLLTCPMIAAARMGEPDILNHLIKAHADVNVRGGPNMSTPLINVATFFDESSIRAIIDAGADINLADEDGNTALMEAAQVGDAEAVQILLDKGADVLLKNHDNQNALQIALEMDSTECVKILVQHVSHILEALRLAIESGDAAVAAIVRSVEARKQGLDYDDSSIQRSNRSSMYQVKEPPVAQGAREEEPQELESNEPTASNLPEQANLNQEASIDSHPYAPYNPSNISGDGNIEAIGNATQRPPVRPFPPHQDGTETPNQPDSSRTSSPAPIRRKPVGVMPGHPNQRFSQPARPVPLPLQPGISQQQQTTPFMPDASAYQGQNPYIAPQQGSYSSPPGSQWDQYRGYQNSSQVVQQQQQHQLASFDGTSQGLGDARERYEPSRPQPDEYVRPFCSDGSSDSQC